MCCAYLHLHVCYSWFLFYLFFLLSCNLAFVPMATLCSDKTAQCTDTRDFLLDKEANIIRIYTIVYVRSYMSCSLPVYNSLSLDRIYWILSKSLFLLLNFNSGVCVGTYKVAGPVARCYKQFRKRSALTDLWQSVIHIFIPTGLYGVSLAHFLCGPQAVLSSKV